MNQNSSPLDSVGVLGMGRFGSFWASFLSTQFKVSVWSAHSVYEPYPFIKGHFPVETVSLPRLCEVPVLFLCNSIGSMKEVAAQIAPHLKAGTLIIDTGSIKSYPLRQLGENLPDSIEILGSHPMFGPDSAKEGTAGLPLVLTPFRCSEEKISQWKKYFLQMGLNVFLMSADLHDQKAAKTQALTHLVGRILDLMTLSIDDCEIATAGYKKLQEVTASVGKDSEDLFEAMQILNPYAFSMRKDFLSALQKVLKSIEQSSFHQLD